MICWTLGITEHHNARRQRPLADQPGAALRPRRALRLGPQPAARPEQRPGRRRHGRDPEQAARLPGHRARRRGAARASRRPGARRSGPSYGWHLTQMFHGMERGELRTLYVIGENPAQSEADITHDPQAARRARLPRRPGHRPDEDGRDGRRRLPLGAPRGARPRARSRTASAACSASARRSTRRARRATTCGSSPSSPAGSATTGPEPIAEEVWDELRSLSPMHAGMSYARLEELGGLQWPCPDESHPGSPLLHERLWAGAARRARPRRSRSSRHRGPFEALDDEYPIRLTTGRRLESYNTGAQTNLYSSPLHRGESLDLSPEDAERLRARRGRDRARLVAPRLGRGAGAHRPVAAARARVHDVPLPGPGRHEPADDRRHRPEVAARPSSRPPRSGSRSSIRPSARNAPASPSRPPSEGSS